MDIAFFLDIVLEDIYIKDLHNNTLLYAEKLQLDVNKFSNSNHIITLGNIILKKSIIGLRRYKGEEKMNFQFIVDYFSSEDTTKTEPENWTINCEGLEIVDSRFIYQDREKMAKEENEKGIDFNNLDLTSLNIIIEDFDFNEDTISAFIQNISFIEQSGFILNEFSTTVNFSPVEIETKGLKIKTPNTAVFMDLTFTYDSLNHFNDFINKVTMNVVIDTSDLYIDDIGYFAPALLGMNNKISLAGEVKGKVNNLNLKKFSFNYGKSTKFFGNISLNGLPNIKETFIHMSIKEFVTIKDDIESFNIPGDSNRFTNIRVPEELTTLGRIKVRGAFTGFYNSFVSNADFYTDLGKVSTDLSFVNNREKKTIEYDGKLSADNFYLGKLLSLEDNIGKLDVKLDIKGSGLDKSSTAFKIKGVIDSVDINQYTYNKISIEGDFAEMKFNGNISLDDPNGKLNFAGIIDYSNDVPVFDFTTDILNAKLNRLNLIESEELTELTTFLNLNFSGDKIDNIKGTIKVDKTSYKEGDQIYTLDNLSIEISINDEGKKNMKLESEFIDADLFGDFHFQSVDLSVIKFIRSYLPSFLIDLDNDREISENQSFEYSVHFKNTGPITQIFIPELIISKNAKIYGSFDSESGSFGINGNAKEIEYNGQVFKNWYINGRTSGGQVEINTGCGRMFFSDSLGIDDLALQTTLRMDSLKYKLVWGKEAKIRNEGKITGFIRFSDKFDIKLQFLKSSVYINNSLWTISDDNYIAFDTSFIKINNISFSNEKQYLKLNGIISKNPKDELKIQFKDFDISNFDFISTKNNLDIDGLINGSVDILGMYGSLRIFTDINIINMFINKNKLGDAEIQTNWDQSKNAIYANLNVLYTGNTGNQIKTVLIDGYYFPDKEEDNLDFDINLTNFNLNMVYPYISSFCSRIKGKAEGELTLKGTLAEPDLQGWLYLHTKRLVIDYLNTDYTFGNKLYFEKDAIVFKDFHLGDQTHNDAYINGKIRHKGFSDFNLNINIQFENFTCLNTSYAQNELYYGKAKATGLVKIRGDVNNIIMDITAKTEKGTEMVIPISSGTEVSESSFITFINQETLSIEEEKEVDLSGITLNFDLEVTPEAKIRILLDPEGEIEATGSGNIRLEITTLGAFNMYGDYIVDGGKYMFALQNVIKKPFVIKKGGSISWHGDPYDAEVNIKAIYKVKTSLSDIKGIGMDSSSVNSKRIPVDCILGLKGNLFSPEIKFNFDLPTSNDESKQLLYSAIDTTNELEVNKQILSLIVINRFTSDESDFTLGEGFGSTSYELLSNQLSSWLSQISNDFDIGINYRPGDKITSDELEVALSTQLFNNRVMIDGNFGVGGDQNTENRQKASNIVGDVNIEVKITDDGRFRIKAYNRSNNDYFSDPLSPYTQGFGIFYRREFDKFEDLFNSKKKKQ